MSTRSDSGRQARGRLAQRLREEPLHLSHAGLAGVVGRYLAERRIGDRDLVGGQRGALELPGQQEVACDGDLVVLGVAVEGDELHPVQQRRRDLLDDVGGRDEEHVGQVQVQLEVVVAERVVLGRVEHLEQRRRGVAAVVRPELVDLVEEHDRVHRAGLLDRPHDPAGERADVGPAVSADLRLVPDATQGDADELPAEGARDRLTQGGLADSRRTGEQRSRRRSRGRPPPGAPARRDGSGRRGTRRSDP